MSTPAPHEQLPLRTATGIFDDLELYPDRLVIRHRDILSRLREQATILKLDDIEAVKTYPKHTDHNDWLEMKIVCHHHTSVEVCYHKDQRASMRELNKLITELRQQMHESRPHD